jgi:hypothetical protein
MAHINQNQETPKAESEVQQAAELQGKSYGIAVVVWLC